MTSGQERSGEGAESATDESLGFALLSILRPIKSSANKRKNLPHWRNVTKSSLGLLIFASILAALCGTAILAVLSLEAKTQHSRSVVPALSFVAVLIAYRWSQIYVMRKASGSIELALNTSRIYVANKLMLLPLSEVEEMTKGRIIDGLTRHYEVLSQQLLPLIACFQSMIVAAFMLVFLVIISPIAGLITIGVGTILIVHFLATESTLKRELSATAEADVELSRMSEDIVNGFKELRLNSVKNSAINLDFQTKSSALTDHRTKRGRIWGDLFVAGTSYSYVIAAAVIFIIPILSGDGNSDTTRIVIPVLFLLGPITASIGGIQQLSTARFIIYNIRELENELEIRGEPSPQYTDYFNGFSKIKFSGLSYSHNKSAVSDTGFVVSELNMTIEAGKIIFITGANGSGKTTALRLFCGLYQPDRGQIELDGSPLVAELRQSYRELFSTVFADFHLFRKPYALSEKGIIDLENTLISLRIRDILPVNLRDGYDANRLSTGQRKRLALALALAENRPILLLDEWAADQDPETRKEFYRTILPRIRDQGKTIIAVCHDDYYFDCADIRYHMDNGRMASVS